MPTNTSFHQVVAPQCMSKSDAYNWDVAVVKLLTGDTWEALWMRWGGQGAKPKTRTNSPEPDTHTAKPEGVGLTQKY